MTLGTLPCFKCHSYVSVRMKIPLQDFALKVQGGLMCEGGGRICGTLRYYDLK